jgi:hypothetical protein
MKEKNNIALLFILIVFSLSACKKTEIADSKEYFSYLANPKNGLVKEKTVAGLTIKVKYIPEDYLVYNMVKDLDLKTLTPTYKDSIAKSYANSVTYMVSIGPAQNEDFDVTRVGVGSYQEFAERIEQMAFNAQDWFAVTIKDKSHTPVIVRMENINALEKSRNFMVIFNSTKGSENDFRKNDMCLTYDDGLFNTGLNKFIFNATDIQELPKFTF